MTDPVAAPPRHALLATAEGGRLLRAVEDGWRRWGPYVSERQWGTVREDYSADGNAWDYFPHDHARSRAYRWGEDGIGGFGDEKLHWCMGIGVWNGQDPILKERLFGLTNQEGNHGEDVKELYYYVDGVPSHAYMRMLYKYPQAAYPYAQLVAENGRRGQTQPEFELIDTGVFSQNRYFDVTVEYAKAAPDDILMRVSACNRGPDAAPLDLLCQVWARNIWSWDEGTPRPVLRLRHDGAIDALHPAEAPMRLHVGDGAVVLFCENETNGNRLFGTHVPGPFKDAFDDYVVHGNAGAVGTDGSGTKCAALRHRMVAPGATIVQRLRFRPPVDADAFADFDAVLATRVSETEAFYGALQAAQADADVRLVQRQAIAGMLWSKQFYCYDVRRWLNGDPAQPAPPLSRKSGRNADWQHLINAEIVSMPDKWEYPWYAAWDLAFHCVTFALFDPQFAKAQLVLLTREWYMHPNAQLPAYEWAFGDVNPPVHAWAAWRVYEMDRTLTGVADRAFLERVFHKLMLNFNWWVNRKDEGGRNIFQGGFLGLDNIGLFDRSKPLPTGGTLNQSDGTAWMAMYALNLLRIAAELAVEDHVYEDIASKFFEHFLLIAQAMTDRGGQGVSLWDEQDQFFYDVLSLPDGRTEPLRVRTMVGLIPLFAVQVLPADLPARLPGFAARMKWLLDHRPDLAAQVSRWQVRGVGDQVLLSLLRGHRMKGVLRRMLDEGDFLSAYGVRAVSKAYAAHPYVLEEGGMSYAISYQPAESESRLFGGNSNWRGPIWMPVNFLIIEALRGFHEYYGADFLVECPVGSGRMRNLKEVADEISARLTRLFLRGPDGRRAVLGDDAQLQEDPHFRDLIPFHEYFHGDTGRGVGASHQTGWTGLVALLFTGQPTLTASSG